MAGQRLLAHELAHVIQQEHAMPGIQGATPVLDAAGPLEREADAAADRAVGGSVDVAGRSTGQAVLRQPATPPGLQRGDDNNSILADFQGLPMYELLQQLNTLPRSVLLDEEAGNSVGGPRLVLAMRVVRAKNERDITGLMTNDRESLRAIPPDQFASILRFLTEPSDRERENINTDLQVPVVIVKPSRVVLRGERIREGEVGLDSDAPEEAISDFEARILSDRDIITGVVLDPDNQEIIGYRVSSVTGLSIVDREGRLTYQTEIPIESPILDPLDFLPSPGTAAKAAAGVGAKVTAKLAAKAAATKGATAGTKLTLGVINQLRKVSKTLTRISGRKAGTIAGKMLQIPKVKALRPPAAPIDRRLMEVVLQHRQMLVNSGVDWGSSNIAACKVLVDGRAVILSARNISKGLHSEARLIAQIEEMVGNKKSVEVLQIFSERIPCGRSRAGCMQGLISQFPKADIFFSVTDELAESVVSGKSREEALKIVYGLRP
jgi:Xanthomonas XOO_2897-like deaminase